MQDRSTAWWVSASRLHALGPGWPLFPPFLAAFTVAINWSPPVVPCQPGSHVTFHCWGGSSRASRAPRSRPLKVLGHATQ